MLRGARVLAATLTVATVAVIASVVSPVWARWKAPAPPAPGDTVVVYGPHRFTTPSGASTLGVEAFPLSWSGEPRFLLQASSGNSDGSLKPTTFTVRLNGTVILTATDLGSAQTATRIVRPREQDTLSVQLSGLAGAFVDVSILQVADPTFLIKQQTFYRQAGSPILETVNFAAGAAAGSPFYMCLLNGREDGTHRNTSATITLNGQDVVIQSDLSPQVGSLIKPVTLQADNVLEVRMSSIPLTEITLCVRATDILAPRLTIATPAQNFVTRDATVSVTGTVQDETPTTVTVNGTAASRSGDGYSGTASLNEGSNTILVHAVDAAGNTTDSARTVIRDSQVPTIVLTSPASQSVTNNAQVTIAGIITDATVTTVNVNGTPVTLDANHAFSIVMTATEGSNFFTVTATDQAGNSTSEARQVTLDTAAPVVTLDAPANQLITNGMTVVVSGTVTDATPVTLTVNGLAVTPAGNGSFSTTVALATEGSNGITVVATDAATNHSDVARSVIRDTQAPVLTVNAPADNLITNQGETTISGAVTDQTALTLTVNGSPVAVGQDGSFSTTVTLGAEGGNVFTIVATDAATNHSDAARTVIRDTQAPTLTIATPANNFITKDGQTTITGSATDATAISLTINGEPVTVGADGAFSATVFLGTEGSNGFTIVATDAATNHSDATHTIIRDSQAPTLSVSAPADGDYTNQTSVHVTGTVLDATAVSLEVNGVPTVLDPSGSFDATVPLTTEGANVILLRATDAGGNSTTTTRSINRDTQAPALAVTAPADAAEFLTPTVTVTGTASDASPFRVTVNGTEVSVSGGSFSRMLTLTEGANVLTVVATDTATNLSTVVRNVVFVPREPGVHPDPSTVAPPLDRTIVTLPSKAAEFLYTGADPIQVGVPANTIHPLRSATIKGKVFNKDLNPMQGVKVSVRDHPEYGYTLSRMDGGYDLVVNGGVSLKVDFAKAGYLPSQRIATVSWQDWTLVDDVMLLQLDAVVTPIAANSAQTQIARASIETDDDGSRQVTAIFKPNTAVTMTLANGTTMPMTSMAIRATEFTVGANGHLSMPAELPTNSAYTYAMQMTADEALAAGATKVTFSQAVPVYIENFLGLTAPAGTQLGVPVGEFDPAVGWIGKPNGVVLKILSVGGGTVTIDLNNDGVAESDAALVAAGIDANERQKLAQTYTAGASLWRFATFHLYPYDANYQGKVLGVDPQGEITAGCVGKLADPIKCDIQVARQAVSLTGTPYALVYGSDRTLGGGDRGLSITLTGPTILPILHKVQLKIDLAGRLFTYAFEPQANLVFPFEWDGKDVWGRPMQGSQRVKIQIEHEYPIEYQLPAPGTGFGQNCTALGGAQNCTLNATTAPESPRKYWVRRQWLETNIGGFDAKGLALGGFTLSAHNFYDPSNQVLYQGDGTTRAAKRLPEVITTLTGGRGGGFSGDGGPAKSATIRNPGRISVGPDGTVYFVDQDNYRIRKISPDGIITSIMGTGFRMNLNQALAAEGQSALGAPIVERMLMLPTPEGELIVVNGGTGHVRKIDKNGIIRTIAGSGGTLGDGGPALNALIGATYGAALAPDGSIFLYAHPRIRKITPDGIINTVAGGDGTGQTNCGINMPAKQATFGPIPGEGGALGPDGSFYFVEWGCVGSNGGRLVRLTPDGMLEAVAGAAPFAGGDQTLARNVFMVGLSFPVIAKDGSIYANYLGGVTIKIAPNNKFQVLCACGGTVATDGNYWKKEPMLGTHGIALGPDGALYVSVLGTEPVVFGFPPPYDINRVRRIGQAMPGVSLGETAIPSEDGAQIYVFDNFGRHLRTLDEINQRILARFGYDASGRLVTLTDDAGRISTIERGPTGQPTAFIASNGERTVLGLDANASLASLTPPGLAPMTMSIDAAGLLSSTTDPLGRDNGGYTYDLAGRLTGIRNPLGGVTTYTATGSTTTSQLNVTTASGKPVVIVHQALPGGVTLDSAALSPLAILKRTDDGQGGQTITFPNRETNTIIHAPDRRLGVTAPMDSVVERMPSGLTRTTKARLGATGADPNDPFAFDVTIDSSFVNGRVSTVTYDDIFKTVSSRSAAGRTVTADLDALGRVTAMTVAGRAPVLNTYDEDGRVSQLTRGGRTTTLGYDSYDRINSVTDALGRTETFTYNTAGLLSTYTFSDGRTMAYDYDAAGNLQSITPPARPAHLLALNPVGLLSLYEAPSIGGTSARTTFAYDSIGRPTKTTLPDGSVRRTFYSATNENIVTVGTNGDSLSLIFNDSTLALSRILRPSGASLAYTWDGRLKTSVTWSGGIQGSAQYTYDADFRLLTERVNNDATTNVTLGYDADGFLTSVGGLIITRDPGNAAATSLTVGGTKASLGYTTVGDVDSMVVTFNSTPRYRLKFAHDAISRIASRDETIEGANSISTFAYDSTGQLRSVTRNGVVVEQYEYDDNGNRTLATSPSGSVAASYNSRDQLVTYGTAAMAYWPGGELAQKSVGTAITTYSYDGWGQLRTVSLPTSTTIDYVLDGEGRRVGKKVNGVTTRRWLYRGDLAIIAELDGNGGLVSRFIYGDQDNIPEYMVRGGVTYRLVRDERGSVRLVMNASTGVVAQRLDYDGFGRVTANTNPGFQPFGFAGGLYDDQTGLVRFGRRDYDAETGRWLSSDPLYFDGGDANLYRYAHNDPVNLIDPTGEVDYTIQAQSEAKELEGELRKTERARDVEKIKKLKQSLCSIAAKSMDTYSKVDNFGSKFGKPFQKHHVLQDAIMDGVEGYSRGIGIAIPLMGGSWLKESPHYLANATQTALKGVGALEVAEESLRQAGCREKDVQTIMKNVRLQMKGKVKIP